jgi:hypothetical protein
MSLPLGREKKKKREKRNLHENAWRVEANSNLHSGTQPLNCGGCSEAKLSDLHRTCLVSKSGLIVYEILMFSTFLSLRLSSTSYEFLMTSLFFMRIQFLFWPFLSHPIDY